MTIDVAGHVGAVLASLDDDQAGAQ